MLAKEVQKTTLFKLKCVTSHKGNNIIK